MSPKKEKRMGTTTDVLEKLRDLDPPKLLAIVDGFGGKENLEAWLRGEKEMTLQDVIRLLVDKNGRLIPAHLGVTSAVCDENRDFHLNRAEFIYEEVIERFREFFPAGTEFVSTDEFTDRSEAAKEKLMGNKLLSNLFKRAAWPLPLPRYEVEDYGRSMKNLFLLAAKAAYKNQFPDREFNIYCGEEMEGKIILLPDYNGHDRLIAKMKEEPAVAWYFPNPMQGFSVLAQREAGKLLLSHGLLLNGAIEPALALVGFTGEMARDFNTPGYDCPAVSWRSAGLSLCFRARDDELDVHGHGSLADADGYYSGGLVLLG